ncbi:hypothetical protein LSAT2_008472 [Lamellibrachia satsuma]|nr:hypothetical protein LSAT2_008472 [Lamellibrachia satsuma]
MGILPSHTPPEVGRGILPSHKHPEVGRGILPWHRHPEALHASFRAFGASYITLDPPFFKTLDPPLAVSDVVTTKTVYLVDLLLYLSSDFGCVRGQPTTDRCNRDTNDGRQEALMEQTFHTLQTMSSRLQSIESHLKSMESHLESFVKWKRSIEQWVKEKDKDTRCKWSVDGNITCYKLVHQYMTWSERRANCQTLGDGADLVSIETQEENEFLLKMIRAEYSSVGSTTALYTLHFVEIAMPCCDHTCFKSPPKAPEAARIRLLISTSMVLSDAIMLPKYVKLLTDFRGVP